MLLNKYPIKFIKALKKDYTVSCSTTSECKDYLALECLGSPSTCSCVPFMYWDGTRCREKKKYNSFSLNKNKINSLKKNLKRQTQLLV